MPLGASRSRLTARSSREMPVSSSRTKSGSRVKRSSSRQGTVRSGSVGPDDVSTSSYQDSRAAALEREGAHVEELRRQLAEERDDLRRVRQESQEMEVALRREADERMKKHQAEVEALQHKLKQAEETEKSREKLLEQQREVHFSAMQQWGDTEASMQKTTGEIMKKRRGEMKALQLSLDQERERRTEVERLLVEKEHALSELGKEGAQLSADNRNIRAQLDESQAEVARIKEELSTMEHILTSKEKDSESVRDVEAQKREVMRAESKVKEEQLTRLVEETRSGHQYQLKRFKDLKDRYLAKKRNHEESKQMLADSAQEVLELRVKVGTLETTDKHRVEVIQQLESQLQDLQPQYDRYSVATGSPEFDHRAVHMLSYHDASPHSSRRPTPSKLRWASSSPPHRGSTPFCSAVKAATPHLPLLDNGPTRYNPFSRDAPAKSNTFRNTTPPTMRQYFFDSAGNRILAPGSRYAVPVPKPRYSTVGMRVSHPHHHSQPRTPPTVRRRSTSEGGHGALTRTPSTRSARSTTRSASVDPKLPHEMSLSYVPSSNLGAPRDELVTLNTTAPQGAAPPQPPHRQDSGQLPEDPVHYSVSEAATSVTQRPLVMRPLVPPPVVVPADEESAGFPEGNAQQVEAAPAPEAAAVESEVHPRELQKPGAVEREKASPNMSRKSSLKASFAEGSPRSFITLTSSSDSKSSSESEYEQNSYSTPHGGSRKGRRGRRGWRRHASSPSASPTMASDEGSYSLTFMEETNKDTTHDGSTTFYEEKDTESRRDTPRDGTELITLDDSDEESDDMSA